MTQNRNLLAITDLGESNPAAPGVVGRGQWSDPDRPQSQLPNNNVNNLLQLINLSAIRSVNNVSSYMQGLGLTAASDYEKIEKEKKLQGSINFIKKRFGPNSVLKLMNLEEAGMTTQRNVQIGGHSADAHKSDYKKTGGKDKP